MDHQNRTSGFTARTSNCARFCSRTDRRLDDAVFWELQPLRSNVTCSRQELHRQVGRLNSFSCPIRVRFRDITSKGNLRSYKRSYFLLHKATSAPTRPTIATPATRLSNRHGALLLARKLCLLRRFRKTRAQRQHTAACWS